MEPIGIFAIYAKLHVAGALWVFLKSQIRLGYLAFTSRFFRDRRS